MIGRRGIFLLTLLLVAPGTALAQEEEPTVSDADYNTTPPAEDESYLDDAEAESTEEPTLSDADFDTSAPTMDESYLDEDVGGDAGGARAATGHARTPGPALVAVLGVVGFAAFVLGRR